MADEKPASNPGPGTNPPQYLQAGKDASGDQATPGASQDTPAPAPRRHRLKTVLLTVFSLVALLIIGLLFYASDYYQASDEAWAAEQSTSSVTVSQLGSGDVAFLPAQGTAGWRPMGALVFYPGGKVEADAYAPLLSRLAERDIACILVRMPLNLAVLDQDAADQGREELAGLLEDSGADTGSMPWLVGGHSLGGAMAASYVSGDAADWQGLVLLAAYSTADLSTTDLPVLTVVGTNDGVVSWDHLDEDVANLPERYRRLNLIQGGIHSYFGSYGLQDGDGTPSISNDDQLDETADTIRQFVDKEV